METGSAPGPIVWIAGGIAALIAIFVIGMLANLGPFSEEELSQGELITKGDRICGEAHEAFTELQAKEPQTSEQAADLTDSLVGIATDELDRIAALDGPAAFDAELERYLTAREEGIAALRRGHQAAEAGDSSAYAEAQAEIADTQTKRREIARQIGFAVCSRPLGIS